MKRKQVFISGIVATGLLMLCHLVIQLGVYRLYNVVSEMFVPGVIVEMKLSGNVLYGFGDWRTPVLINIVTWLMFLALTFVSIKLWRFAVDS